jgi:RimJ/RimL family protein N-acetyltransferase
MTLVRRLLPIEFKKYEEHLCRLNMEDRRLRFGIIRKDESIRDYVENISSLNDVIFACFDDDLNVVGAAHVSFIETEHGKIAELGFSVERQLRGKGIGTILFEKAVEWGENRQIDQLFTQCLTENSWMMRKARQEGMQIHNDGMETEAYLKLEKHFPHFSKEVLEEGLAWIDFGFKSQFHILKEISENIFNSST